MRENESITAPTLNAEQHGRVFHIYQLHITQQNRHMKLAREAKGQYH